MRSFLDTNVLLHAVSKTSGEAGKAMAALSLLDDPEAVISVQVVQEFYVQATHANRPDRLNHEQACLLMESWRRFKVAPMTEDLVFAALATKQRWGLSYWDSAIIEAARAAGCDRVLSEDMQDGQDFGGVKVLNPFV